MGCLLEGDAWKREVLISKEIFIWNFNTFYFFLLQVTINNYNRGHKILKHIKILVKVQFTTSKVVHVVHFEVWCLLKDGTSSEPSFNRAALIRRKRLFWSEYQRRLVNFRLLTLSAPTPQNGQYTQTIIRQNPTNYLSMFDHFVGLALKGLSYFFGEILFSSP